MVYNVSELQKNSIVLLARLLLVLLFLVSGWAKINNFASTMAYLEQKGLPFAPVTTVVVVIIEILISAFLLLGLQVRTVAVFAAIYTVGAGLIGHNFWMMDGSTRVANAVNFYKNLGLAGGFLLLYVTGPGDYSIRRAMSR